MEVRIENHPRFPGVFLVRDKEKGNKIATRNLSIGKSVYGESLFHFKDSEYRIWDPFRSKLAAAILKGLKCLPIEPGHNVLYLGAASGTTSSHVSDIIGDKGYVFCVEFAHRSIRDLIDNVCRFRTNMSPILADARFPETYSMLVGRIDVIYCDIAQPEQSKILANNADFFLKEGGWTILALKARSIDVTKEPTEVFEGEKKILKDSGFDIYEAIRLEPYDKDHLVVVSRYSPP